MIMGRLVVPKSGEGGPRHVREQIHAQKGDIWRGGLTVGRGGEWACVGSQLQASYC